MLPLPILGGQQPVHPVIEHVAPWPEEAPRLAYLHMAGAADSVLDGTRSWRVSTAADTKVGEAGQLANACDDATQWLGRDVDIADCH